MKKLILQKFFFHKLCEKWENTFIQMKKCPKSAKLCGKIKIQPMTEKRRSKYSKLWGKLEKWEIPPMLEKNYYVRDDVITNFSRPSEKIWSQQGLLQQLLIVHKLFCFLFIFIFSFFWWGWQKIKKWRRKKEQGGRGVGWYGGVLTAQPTWVTSPAAFAC